MAKTYSPVVVGSVALLALGACGKEDDPLSSLSNHAVGTFIGGGSLFGPESCA